MALVELAFRWHRPHHSWPEKMRSLIPTSRPPHPPGCHRIAEDEYALKVQAQRYGELYQELAAVARGPRRFASGSMQANIAADDGEGAL